MTRRCALDFDGARIPTKSLTGYERYQDKELKMKKGLTKERFADDKTAHKVRPSAEFTIVDRNDLFNRNPELRATLERHDRLEKKKLKAVKPINLPINLS